MIEEIAIERVRLFCVDGHWQQEIDYDVVRYADPGGGEWEFFSVDGSPVMSPYTQDGRPFCPVCRRGTAAKLVSRRLVPVPRGPGAHPFEERPDRTGAPLLEARFAPEFATGSAPDGPTGVNPGS
jgi:hypothetical protein